MIITKSIDSDKPPLLLRIIEDNKFIPKFHERLKKPNINVCDIGCGFPLYLIVLNEKYKLAKAVCNDRYNEQDLVIEYIRKQGDPTLNGITSLAELYFKLGGGSIKSATEFNKIFIDNSYFGIGFEYFFMKCKEQFDLVIFQNVMHLYDECNYKILIRDIKKKCKEDGIIFIRVQNKFEFNHELYKSIIADYFEGTIYEYYLNGVFESSYFINIKD